MLGDRSRRRALAAALLGVAFVRVRRAIERARSVPLSPLRARGRVGASYLDRHGVETGAPVAGEMDDMDEYARPGFDPDRVDPAVRRFYERTADYALAYRVTWHRGFRVGAALAGRLTRRIEQLNLPARSTTAPRRLESRFVELAAAADPREAVRAWIRTDPDTDEAVFVALYGSHVRDGVRYVNIAAPLPLSNLSTVLRIDPLPTRADGDGLRLTTRGRSGDEGLFLVTPLGAAALPLDQTFRVWPADALDAPDDVTGGRADVVATHEMWVFGRKFLTVTYAGWVDGAAGSRPRSGDR